jgi:hypothetical protein
MTMKLAEITLWQRNLASLIRSGLYRRAAVAETQGLFQVVGIYGDGSQSAPLAKYSDRRRAEDAVHLIDNLLALDSPVESN